MILKEKGNGQVLRSVNSDLELYRGFQGKNHDEPSHDAEQIKPGDRDTKRGYTEKAFAGVGASARLHCATRGYTNAPMPSRTATAARRIPMSRPNPYMLDPPAIMSERSPSTS